MQVLKNKKLAGKAANYLDDGVETLLGLLQIPDHYVEFKTLMCPSLVPPIDGYFESPGLCDTLGSPLEGYMFVWRRWQRNKRTKTRRDTVPVSLRISWG